MIEIVPAMDLRDGRCVRLEQGDFARCTSYAGDPVTVAKSFEDAGLRRLHLVDLDGAVARRPMNLSVLEGIVRETRLLVDFSGGLSSDIDIQAAFDAGAAEVTCGTVAVKAPGRFAEWLEKFGAERVILGADVRGEFLSVSGWKENTPLLLGDFLQSYSERGVRKVMCTEISRDGMLEGPALNLYRRLRVAFPSLDFVASGGVRDVRDIQVLEEIGMARVIVGKAIFENRISLKELAEC